MMTRSIIGAERRCRIGAEEQRELLERLDVRIDGLLRKAIVQAGFSEALAETRNWIGARVAFGLAPTWPTDTAFPIISSGSPATT